ncbi:hypothetical protein SAMN04489724_3033 [Algoriphagus locisalis]|uniref:Uncharacterized protein n=1 Tax=Algoriphagus locisalis TaxID=305507 RepID=A0A1I7CBD1_9BACT|nr:hypothetical protein SAMN04489724_3033 [Algoriphagus locisalis]
MWVVNTNDFYNARLFAKLQNCVKADIVIKQIV